MKARRIFAAAFAAATLLSPAAFAQSGEDKGILILVMQDMDGAIEDLEPFIGAHKVPEAKDAAIFLQEALVWAKDYFAANPDTPDGAAYAQAGLETTAKVIAALDAADFDAALEQARALSDNCKTCHDAYRP